jgi:hypothetical protein
MGDEAMKAMTSAFWLALILAVAVLIGSTADAATPPPYMNYQGVLRDAADNPLDGTHDMVFRFFSPADEEILIDRHTTAQGGAVTVSGGLFDVRLGAGATSDGSGPGTYGSLIEVFRDYGEVYLEVQIGADGAPGTEVLTPRTRVFSTAYALNASNLAGEPITNLLRSDESDAYTSGTLTFNPGTTLDVDGGLSMDGAVTKATTDHVANFNADLLDNLDSSAFASAAHGHAGGEITGPVGEASNADLLDGFDSTYFVNTSSAGQTKTGPLYVDAGSTGSLGFRAVGTGTGGFFDAANYSGRAYLAEFDTGIRASGTVSGGQFSDSDGTGWAYVGYLDEGISAHGTVQGGFFQDDDSTGQAHVAYGDRGIEASGTASGGYFWDSDSSGVAYAGHGDFGIWASGNAAGGYFSDLDGSGYANVGYGDEGINAKGNLRGGYFADLDDSGYALVGHGDRGISGYGSSAGGYFQDSDSSGYASVGHGDRGISSYGSFAGGYFKDSDESGYAYVGSGNLGIASYGSTAGGVFYDSDSSGYARVGYGDSGIQAHGSLQGGYFADTDNSGYARVGYGDRGISASGGIAGGYFGDSDNTGYAYVGYGDSGIEAFGAWTGGYFEDTDQSAHAHVAVGNIGVDARGSQGGGYFADNASTGWAYIGYDTYKVWGNGGVSFVQNHPYEPDKVVVYTAPEGDEVATYTRGTARLVDGEARVALGKTFAWVTNPDIGLTAHVTPRSPDAVVYVESISTEELVVRNVAGFPGDAAFDYLVYGLRIGFEEKSVVQPKKLESYIPSMAGDRALYEQAPELRSFSALERFKGMREVVFLDEAGPLDLTASQALRDAIHEYDPGTDPPLGELAGHGTGRKRERPPRSEATEPTAPAAPETEPGGESPTAVAGFPTIPGEETQNDTELTPTYPTFPVSEAVEPGDLLGLDPERPGVLRKVGTAAEPGVFGIAATESEEFDGVLHVGLANGLYTVVKADAGYGEIRPGDLLTSSFTPGHAMRATEIVPGTVIGKAAEPLETGTGLIRVLVMPR